MDFFIIKTLVVLNMPKLLLNMNGFDDDESNGMAYITVLTVAFTKEYRAGGHKDSLLHSTFVFSADRQSMNLVSITNQLQNLSL